MTALGPNGYPMQREVDAAVNEGALVINLEPDVLYYLVERR